MTDNRKDRPMATTTFTIRFDHDPDVDTHDLIELLAQAEVQVAEAAIDGRPISTRMVRSSWQGGRRWLAVEVPATREATCGNCGMAVDWTAGWEWHHVMRDLDLGCEPVPDDGGDRTVDLAATLACGYCQSTEGFDYLEATTQHWNGDEDGAQDGTVRLFSYGWDAISEGDDVPGLHCKDCGSSADLPDGWEIAWE